MSETSNKKFFKHFIIIGSGTLFNLIIGLFTTPLITRIVDPTEYGKLSIFSMYESIAIMVICMGLDQALVRFFYEENTLAYKRALLFRCVKVPASVCLGLSIAVMLASVSGTITFEFPSIIMILLCLYCICGLVYRFSLLVVRLSYQSKLYSMLNILQKISYVGFAVPILLLTNLDDFQVLAFSTMIACFICLTISILVQKEMWSISLNDDSMCSVSRKDLIKYAYPYIFSMGITTLFQAIDKLSLNYYCSYTEVGIYSSTMTLVHIFAVIQTTFNTLWAPMAVEHYSKDKEDKSFYQCGNSVITIIMFFIGISLILCKDLFAILLGEKYREAAYILPFLIFNPIMYTISETTVSGLVFMKKSKMQVVVAIGACLTNIIGNTILVPQLGCQGAAISTGVSYIVFFSLRTFLSNRYYAVDYKLGKFYLLTITVSVYALYNTFIKFNVLSVVGYIICLLLLIILYKSSIIWIISYLLGYEKIMVKRG